MKIPGFERANSIFSFIIKVVGEAVVARLLFFNALRQGAGETEALKRKGYFARRPHRKSQASVVRYKG